MSKNAFLAKSSRSQWVKLFKLFKHDCTSLNMPQHNYSKFISLSGMSHSSHPRFLGNNTTSNAILCFYLSLSQNKFMKPINISLFSLFSFTLTGAFSFVDCKQSLFFLHLATRVRECRAPSAEWLYYKTWEMRAAAWEEKRETACTARANETCFGLTMQQSKYTTRSTVNRLTRRVTFESYGTRTMKEK